ncbi:MAG: pyrroline-5-carboxylate reductase [Planctomycetota bacterium]|jgi:pyrroline-5-carboxylate reductase
MIERKMGFIGAGTMAGALIGGMLGAGVAVAENLFAADPDELRRAALARIIGRNVLTANRWLAERCEVVVLSVKPDVVPVVAREIAFVLTDDHLVISIAAGVTLEALQGIIRVMPNTPALVRQGASAYCTARGVTDEDASLVEEMLGSVGVCVQVDQKHMDAVTGLSGSGPAYVYLAIEALTDGGVQMGLPRDVATRLAAQTAAGAARMVLETGRHPGELRDDVTTPGGTTVEGLRVLEEAEVPRAFVAAVVAATEKSRRLSRQD